MCANNSYETITEGSDITYAQYASHLNNKSETRGKACKADALLRSEEDFLTNKFAVSRIMLA